MPVDTLFFSACDFSACLHINSIHATLYVIVSDISRSHKAPAKSSILIRYSVSLTLQITQLSMCKLTCRQLL